MPTPASLRVITKMASDVRCWRPVADFLLDVEALARAVIVTAVTMARTIPWQPRRC